MLSLSSILFHFGRSHLRSWCCGERIHILACVRACLVLFIECDQVNIRLCAQRIKKQHRKAKRKNGLYEWMNETRQIYSYACCCCYCCILLLPIGVLKWWRWCAFDTIIAIYLCKTSSRISAKAWLWSKQNNVLLV